MTFNEPPKLKKLSQVQPLFSYIINLSFDFLDLSFNITLMHAYLIVGTNNKKINQKIEEISKKLKAQPLEFPLQKIADARDMGSFVKLKRAKKRVLVLRNIGTATTEALNAFLKNLEEPQENISFILTSSSDSLVLPTILSRCQIVKVGKRRIKNKDILDTNKFLKMDAINRLDYLENVRSREEAIVFMETFIFSCHKLLKTNPEYFSFVLTNASKTLENLKANANVNLQLTNFAINLPLI